MRYRERLGDRYRDINSQGSSYERYLDKERDSHSDIVLKLVTEQYWDMERKRNRDIEISANSNEKY